MKENAIYFGVIGVAVLMMAFFLKGKATHRKIGIASRIFLVASIVLGIIAYVINKN